MKGLGLTIPQLFVQRSRDWKEVRHEVAQHNTQAQERQEFRHCSWILKAAYFINRAWSYFEAPRANKMAKVINAIRKELVLFQV